MKELPITMTGGSVQALQAGTKTQTRRAIDKQPDPRTTSLLRHGDEWLQGWHHEADGDTPAGIYHRGEPHMRLRPRYQTGDLLWVKETWLELASCDVHMGQPYYYRAGFTSDSERLREEYGYRWRSPRFMPKKAARIWLEVKDVRAERLQMIAEHDAREEGCLLPDYGSHLLTPSFRYPYRAVYMATWDTINAKRGFPWGGEPLGLGIHIHKNRKGINHGNPRNQISSHLRHLPRPPPRRRRRRTHLRRHIQHVPLRAPAAPCRCHLRDTLRYRNAGHLPHLRPPHDRDGGSAMTASQPHRAPRGQLPRPHRNNGGSTMTTTPPPPTGKLRAMLVCYTSGYATSPGTRLRQWPLRINGTFHGERLILAAGEWERIMLAALQLRQYYADTRAVDHVAVQVWQPLAHTEHGIGIEIATLATTDIEIMEAR